jgi:hypothetical protein
MMSLVFWWNNFDKVYVNNLALIWFIFRLFGNEDVDLRQLPPNVPVVMQTVPPSPPPPPVISQPSPVPPSASSQDSSGNTTLSLKQPSPEREGEESEVGMDECKSIREEDGKENGESELKSRGWAKYKEKKPDTYKSPLRPLGRFGRDELDLQKSHSSAPGSSSQLRGRDVIYGSPRDRGMSHFHRNAGKFDKLGRPLLYHRLPGMLEQIHISFTFLNFTLLL